MRILVVGAGSTGGYFGGRLLEAGRDVSFLVRPGRAAQLRKRGLEIVSPHGNTTLEPPLLTADELSGAFDVILLTVKAYGLAQALDDMAPAVGPNTLILPVLNGMRHVDAIRRRFGDANLVGCVCLVATTLDDDGRVVQQAEIQRLSYGEMSGERSERIEQVHALLSDAGFETELSTTIERDMWEKWTMLASMGGINSLMRAPIGAIVAAPEGLAFIHAFIAEVASVVRAVGVAPRADFLAWITDLLTEADAPRTSSMYRDLCAGEAVEVDQILGDLVARAADSTLDLPLLKAAYTHLAIYDAHRQAGGEAS